MARRFFSAAGGFSIASLVPAALAQGKIKPGPDAALVVVDVQNCFLPGGSLAVKAGDEIIPVINRIAKSFQNVVLTQVTRVSSVAQPPWNGGQVKVTA